MGVPARSVLGWRSVAQGRVSGPLVVLVLEVADDHPGLYVRRAAPEAESRISIGLPKTCAAKRTVPLPQILIDALTPRIAGRQADQPAITSPNGAMLRSNTWRRHAHWSHALRTTKLAPLTIHDLRHTYASLARKSGADLRYVQKTMGHSTPTATANIYSDLYSDELDQVATNLDRLHRTETVMAAPERYADNQGSTGWSQFAPSPWGHFELTSRARCRSA